MSLWPGPALPLLMKHLLLASSSGPSTITSSAVALATTSFERSPLPASLSASLSAVLTLPSSSAVLATGDSSGAPAAAQPGGSKLVLPGETGKKLKASAGLTPRVATAPPLPSPSLPTPAVSVPAAGVVPSVPSAPPAADEAVFSDSPTPATQQTHPLDVEGALVSVVFLAIPISGCFRFISSACRVF